jgi:hypothetical protein
MLQFGDRAGGDHGRCDLNRRGERVDVHPQLDSLRFEDRPVRRPGRAGGFLDLDRQSGAFHLLLDVFSGGPVAGRADVTGSDPAGQLQYMITHYFRKIQHSTSHWLPSSYNVGGLMEGLGKQRWSSPGGLGQGSCREDQMAYPGIPPGHARPALRKDSFHSKQLFEDHAGAGFLFGER